MNREKDKKKEEKTRIIKKEKRKPKKKEKNIKRKKKTTTETLHIYTERALSPVARASSFALLVVHKPKSQNTQKTMCSVYFYAICRRRGWGVKP